MISWSLPLVFLWGKAFLLQKDLSTSIWLICFTPTHFKVSSFLVMLSFRILCSFGRVQWAGKKEYRVKVWEFSWLFNDRDLSMFYRFFGFSHFKSLRDVWPSLGRNDISYLVYRGCDALTLIVSYSGGSLHVWFILLFLL